MFSTYLGESKQKNGFNKELYKSVGVSGRSPESVWPRWMLCCWWVGEEIIFACVIFSVWWILCAGSPEDRILYLVDWHCGWVLSGCGASLVTVFVSCLKLAEEQEGGVMPLPAVGECELVGLGGHQAILDYQLLAFLLRIQSWLFICICIIHKWIKMQQNRVSSGGSDCRYILD